MADEREFAFVEPAEARARILPSESGVAKPEIEADEGSKEACEDELAAVKGESGVAGCPIPMFRRFQGDKHQICRRKLHTAPDGIDEVPVCLMHSNDSDKQLGPLFDAFWMEFERILEDAGGNVAHFEGFVFPGLRFIERNFHAVCRFDGATFSQGADFNSATFARGAHFFGARFIKGVDFSQATFTQDADFQLAGFTQDAGFRRATFTQRADFLQATFEQDAVFTGATFARDASFIDATFTQFADFVGATFAQEAYFDRATFTQIADFNRANFAQAAMFCGTTFHRTCEWYLCRFLDQVEFHGTKFESQVRGEPSAVFGLARFSKPSEAVFDDVDLSRVLFHDCDVSQIWFTSSVRWAKRKNDRGLAVFEETIPLEHWRGRELQRDGQRDYRAVEQIYQQLKKSYDSRLDYGTANDFHFGEMEMKRLAAPTGGLLLGLRQWLRPRLSLVALYRYASDYGNSYVKPMLLLLGTLVLFAALLPLPGAGLKRGGADPAETYTSAWRTGQTAGQNLWREICLAGKSVLTSLDTAALQRNPEYAPAYPWGRVLAIIETALTSTLLALFLLAIRRQFKR